MASFDWPKLMTEWNRELFDDEDVTRWLSSELISSRWMGYPGATDEQLAQAETRLGAALPNSYRDFLAFSNGWGHLGPFIYKLWSTEEIEWFAVRNQDWVDAYTDPFPYAGALPPVTDEQYFVYGDKQDNVAFRPEYMQTALEISDVGDSAIMLLNPQVVTPDGEWEAWFFANWLPGARRYRSFWDMMNEEYDSYLVLKKER